MTHPLNLVRTTSQSFACGIFASSGWRRGASQGDPGQQVSTRGRQAGSGR